MICDLVRQEQSEQQRVIAGNDAFIAFAPYASFRPYEVWIVPRIHQAGLVDAKPSADQLLAELVCLTVRRFNSILGETGIHQALYAASIRETHPADHWYLEMFPIVPEQDRFSGDGDMRVNPVPPEEAAEQLRDSGV